MQVKGQVNTTSMSDASGNGYNLATVDDATAATDVLDAADDKVAAHSITSSSRYLDARDSSSVTVHNFRSRKRTYWLVK